MDVTQPLPEALCEELGAVPAKGQGGSLYTALP